MEAIGVTAEWKSIITAGGKEYAAATGARKKLTWCAKRLAAAVLSFRVKGYILEKHGNCLE